MSAIASDILSLTIVYSAVYSGADKKNIKAQRHWPLCGEFTGDVIMGHANHGLSKRLLSSPHNQENSKIQVHDYTCIYHKPDWLLQQFDEWITRESHQETPACAKHNCQTSVHSEEIWSHPCTRYVSLASCQIPDWMQTLLIVLKGLHGKASSYTQEIIPSSKSRRYSMRSNGACVLKAPKFKHYTSAVSLWHWIAWQRKLHYVTKFKNSSETFSVNLWMRLLLQFNLRIISL